MELGGIDEPARRLPETRTRDRIYVADIARSIARSDDEADVLVAAFEAAVRRDTGQDESVVLEREWIRIVGREAVEEMALRATPPDEDFEANEPVTVYYMLWAWSLGHLSTEDAISGTELGGIDELYEAARDNYVPPPQA